MARTVRRKFGWAALVVPTPGRSSEPPGSSGTARARPGSAQACSSSTISQRHFLHPRLLPAPAPPPEPPLPAATTIYPALVRWRARLFASLDLAGGLLSALRTLRNFSCGEFQRERARHLAPTTGVQGGGIEGVGGAEGNSRSCSSVHCQPLL